VKTLTPLVVRTFCDLGTPETVGRRGTDDAGAVGGSGRLNWGDDGQPPAAAGHGAEPAAIADVVLQALGTV
jgi:hypothetical protein